MHGDVMSVGQSSYHNGYDEGYRDGVKAERERQKAELACGSRVLLPGRISEKGRNALRAFAVLAGKSDHFLGMVYDEILTAMRVAK